MTRVFANAKEIGAEIIALTGCDGGKLRKYDNYNIHIARNSIQITEDEH